VTWHKPLTPPGTRACKNLPALLYAFLCALAFLRQTFVAASAKQSVAHLLGCVLCCIKGEGFLQLDDAPHLESWFDTLSLVRRNTVCSCAVLCSILTEQNEEMSYPPGAVI
jgi:hypothetical protein